MAGTIEGGRKAAQRNLENDPEFYKRIGSIGGTKSGEGGFRYAKKHYSEDDPRHPRNAGRAGGAISRKGVKNAEAN